MIYDYFVSNKLVFITRLCSEFIVDTSLMEYNILRQRFNQKIKRNKKIVNILYT